jgi:hypothetical protein
MFNFKDHAITFLVGVVVGCAAMALAQPDVMSQESFPCQEDEVLGYAPQFGPDSVGCIYYLAIMEETK